MLGVTWISLPLSHDSHVGGQSPGELVDSRCSLPASGRAETVVHGDEGTDPGPLDEWHDLVWRNDVTIDIGEQYIGVLDGCQDVRLCDGT